MCVDVLVCVCTWEPGEQTVELSLGQRSPGQVQRGGLAFDDASQGLVTERAAPTHVHMAPQTLVTAPVWDSETGLGQGQNRHLVQQMKTRPSQTHTLHAVVLRLHTYHLYQALQTVMQASSSALLRYLNTDTHTSFSPPLSLPTSLKDGRDSRDGGDREDEAGGAAVSSSEEEDAE